MNRSSALSRRLKERDREIESDNRDRQKEKDEIDELRRRLTDEGHPDPLAEVRRVKHPFHSISSAFFHRFPQLTRRYLISHESITATKGRRGEDAREVKG